MLKGLRVEFYVNLFNILNDISVTLGKKYSFNKKKPPRVSRIDYIVNKLHVTYHLAYLIKTKHLFFVHFS